MRYWAVWISPSWCSTIERDAWQIYEYVQYLEERYVKLTIGISSSTCSRLSSLFWRLWSVLIETSTQPESTSRYWSLSMIIKWLLIVWHQNASWGTGEVEIRLLAALKPVSEPRLWPYMVQRDRLSKESFVQAWSNWPWFSNKAGVQTCSAPLNLQASSSVTHPLSWTGQLYICCCWF